MIIDHFTHKRLPSVYVFHQTYLSRIIRLLHIIRLTLSLYIVLTALLSDQLSDIAIGLAIRQLIWISYRMIVCPVLFTFSKSQFPECFQMQKMKKYCTLKWSEKDIFKAETFGNARKYFSYNKNKHQQYKIVINEKLLSLNAPS